MVAQTLFDTGGATSGLNIMYERNSKLQVYLCRGNSRVMPLAYSVPSSSLGKEIDIILTFEYLSGGDVELTLYVDGVATTVKDQFSDKWTGGDGATFGLMSGSQCTITSEKADFSTGTINADYGLWFFSESVYKPLAAGIGMCMC